LSFPKDVTLHNSTNLFQKRRTEEGKERVCHLLSPCYELLEATGCPAREGHGEEEDDEVEEDDDELHLEHGEE